MTEQKAKRITIKTESGSKWFKDPKKLEEWILNQINFLNIYDANVARMYELKSLCDDYNNHWHQLLNLVKNGLLKNINDKAAYAHQVESFERVLNGKIANKQIFTDSHPHYKFLERQRKNNSIYGFAALSTVFNKNMKLDAFALEGINQAKSYLSGSKEKINDENESFSSTTSRWDEEYSNNRDKLNSTYQKEIDRAEHLNKSAEGLIDSWKTTVSEQSAELKEHKENFQASFDQSMSKTNEELERLTKTYDDKLALHAAVQYWKLQHKSHNKKATIFGLCLIAAVIIAVGGIIMFSATFLDQSIKDIHISRLLTAGVLTSFGVWIVKILSNLYMSHLHLATDAQERRTMMHTYLALIRKGQGPKDDERQLILQTLFRPSSSDMVKNDTGPASMVDMLNRISIKQ